MFSLSPRLCEGNHLAGRIAAVARSERQTLQAPARVGRHRNGNIWQMNAGKVDAVGIVLRHVTGIDVTSCSLGWSCLSFILRWHDAQDTVVDPRTPVIHVPDGRQSVIGYTRDLRESLPAVRQRGDERP